MDLETARERTTDVSSTPFEPVLRPRVIERLRQAASRRITLVVAPAGFGKSVAIRQYLESEGIEHLRFSVRKEHDSLVGFLRGLVLSLEPIAPKASKSVAGAYEKASRGATPVRDLAAWVAALLSRYEGTVVVDDLHFATGDNSKNFLAETIDRSNSKVSWIIAARTDVDLPAASWLAYGQREEALGQETLKLTVDEARRACEIHRGSASAQELDKVLEITQGWPVAFSFALRTSVTESDLTVAALGSRERTYAYLADQVFKSLTGDQQGFLLKTCMLPRLDLRILKAIDLECEAHIDALRNNASFLLPDGQDSFRYHDLFRDFLEHVLRRRGERAFHEALVNVADRLVHTGAFDHALTLYLRHGLHSYLAPMLESHGWSLLEAGALDRVTAALGLVDKRTFSESPMLLCLQAKIDDGAGAYDSADLFFERAVTISSEGDEIAQIAERWAVSLLNRFQIDRADEVIGRVDIQECNDINVSCRLLSLKSVVDARLGKTVKSEEVLRAALEKLPLITEQTTLAFCLHYAGYVSLWLGHSIEARDYCRKSLALSRELGLYDLGGRASSVLHELAASRDDVRELIYALDEMTRFGRLSGDPGLRQFALFSDYDASIERGDFERALRLEVDVMAEAPLDAERWAQTVVAADAMRLACDGRFLEAYLLEAKYRLERCPLAARALRAAELALYSSCATSGDLAKVELETALSLLPQSHENREEVSGRMAKAIALVSLALMMQGLPEKATVVLRLIGKARAAHGSVGLLTNAVQFILAADDQIEDSSGLESALAALAASRLGGYAKLIKSVRMTKGRPFSVGSLTNSEAKIMNLLKAGFSSKEIASKLGRSRLTVDTHVKTILRKLGCNSRREAIAKLSLRDSLNS